MGMRDGHKFKSIINFDESVLTIQRKLTNFQLTNLELRRRITAQYKSLYGEHSNQNNQNKHQIFFKYLNDL